MVTISEITRPGDKVDIRLDAAGGPGRRQWQE